MLHAESSCLRQSQANLAVVQSARGMLSLHVCRVRFQLPLDLLTEQTVRTARITCCDYLAITLLGRGLSPDKPELWLPFKVAFPSPQAPPAAG